MSGSTTHASRISIRMKHNNNRVAGKPQSRLAGESATKKPASKRKKKQMEKNR